jgi:hypothetical protein
MRSVSGADQRDVHVVSGVHMPRFADAGWYDSTTLIIRSKAAAAIGHAANTRCRKVAPRQANGGILLGPFGVVSHMLVGGMRGTLHRISQQGAVVASHTDTIVRAPAQKRNRLRQKDRDQPYA